MNIIFFKTQQLCVGCHLYVIKGLLCWKEAMEKSSSVANIHTTEHKIFV